MHASQLNPNPAIRKRTRESEAKCKKAAARKVWAAAEGKGGAGVGGKPNPQGGAGGKARALIGDGGALRQAPAQRRANMLLRYSRRAGTRTLGPESTKERSGETFTPGKEAEAGRSAARDERQTPPDRAVYDKRPVPLS